jgi:hypothetical protein
MVTEEKEKIMSRSLKFLLGLAVATTALTFPQTAKAAILNLTANLDGNQAGTGSPGTGFASMDYDPDTNKLNWNIGFTGLSGIPTVAHFHGPAAPGTNAGIQVTIATGSVTNPLTSPLIGMANITDAQESQLLAGLWYINIHTNQFPAGEIRGQVNTVPEPSSLGLIGIVGATLLGYSWRRKNYN